MAEHSYASKVLFLAQFPDLSQFLQPEPTDWKKGESPEGSILQHYGKYASNYYPSPIQEGPTAIDLSNYTLKKG